jgi:post-segregation antitoxin (ccd killing protein)
MGLVEVDSELLEQAREAGVDVGRVVREALARAVEVQRREVIRQEIRRDLETLEKHIARYGDPVAAWDEEFGPPGAA